MPIFIEAPVTGNYNLTLDRSSVNTSWKIYLVDTRDSSQFDLRQTSVSFYYNTTDLPHRYWLIVNPSGIGFQELSLEVNKPLVWLRKNELRITFEQSPSQYSIKIMNAAGQLIYQTSKLSGNDFIIPATEWNDVPGLLIVEIETEKDQFIEQVFYTK